LGAEGGDHAAVFEAHAGPVRVEDARDAGLDASVPVVRHHERLGVPLGLVVHTPRADRVDVAPIRLDLGVHRWIAVDLGCRRHQEAGAVPERQVEQRSRAVTARIQRLERQLEVVDRRRRRGQVVDAIDLGGDVEPATDVGLYEREAPVPRQVCDVARIPRDEVVDRDDVVSVREQSIDEVGPDEAGAAGDDDTHGSPCL
jgi:hypothetical protein